MKHIYMQIHAHAHIYSDNFYLFGRESAEMNRYRREVKDVQMVGISIVCPGRPEIELTQPFISSPKAYLFTLKEGTKYSLIFSFIISNRLVSDLKYENTLWKAGIRGNHNTKPSLLNTYAYTYIIVINSY